MARGISVGIVVALAALGAWTFPRLEVQSDITHFLPAGDDRELAELSRELTASSLNRTITLTIEAPDGTRAAAAATALAEKLAEVDEVAWVRSGPDDELERAFYELYFPRRLGLVEAPYDDAWIRGQLERLRGELGSPTGTFVRRIAPEDPWLLFMEHVEALRASQGADLHVRDGAFVTGEREQYGVVILASRASPFEGPASRRLLAAIDAAFEAVNDDGSLRLEQASVHRIAVRSEQTIRADIQRVSVVGTIGVILLILILFQTPRHLVLAALPLLGGMVAATFAVTTLMGSIHGLTLAFGASLIGVALDYVAHLLNHHHLARRGASAQEVLRRIWPGLALGAATTIAGLVGLAWTSFPGIRQMAIFTSVGVAAALLITRWVLPPWMPAEPKTTRVHAWLAHGATRFVDALSTRRRLLWSLPFVGLMLAAGIFTLRWQDDIRALNPLDPTLVAEDEAVRSRVARMDSGRFVVAFGDDAEQSLQRNDAVYGALREAVDAGELGGFRSLHPVLLSAAEQTRRRAAIPEDAWSRTEAILKAEGFVPELFEPFREALAADFAPLRPEDLDETPLGQIAGAHQLPIAGRRATLTFVHGVREVEALRTRVETIEGVRFFDQAELMQSAYGGFRTRTLELVVLGLFVVFALVLLRYRRIGLALAAFLPAFIAAGATLGLLGWVGMHANLLHVVALLLVLSMGVDYGVFMIETLMPGHDREDGPATVVSLLTACLSTVVSFGVLAMSTNPALQALGLTSALGVGLSLLLAPAAWVLARVDPPSTPGSTHPE